MDILKRYKYVLALSILLLISYIVKPEFGSNAIGLTWINLKQMLFLLPPIFLILGLLDVWVPKETMIKLMGKDSGVQGGILAFLMGSAAAGPLYAAFPVAHMLIKKEASLINVFVFIGAWSTTKIPMFLFEMSALGVGFSLSRLLLNIPIIVLIASLSLKISSKQDQIEIYNKAKSM
ncbi:MAG: permease [Clostridiaceae bacterium BRH_c20a]|nr:MAG: permease [Clostridiaceae bacterium BRH_c20a]